MIILGKCVLFSMGYSWLEIKPILNIALCLWKKKILPFKKVCGFHLKEDRVDTDLSGGNSH